MTLWIALMVVIGMVGLQLAALAKQRRLFLRDPQRRRFFLGYVTGDDVASRPRPGNGDATEPATSAGTDPSARRAPSAATPAAADAEAVVYVDASGQCTFANQAARELLHWNAGDLSLRDMLAGGRGESDALMESLARRGLVEQHPSTLAGPTRAPLEISAVAVRDRDDNLWGAALFIRRAVGVPAVAAHARRASSRH